MTNITWSIRTVWVKPVNGDLTNVVATVEWQCVGSVDGASSAVYGKSSFTPQDGDFTPYESLTEPQVIDWVWSTGVDKDAIESEVTQKLSAQLAKPEIIVMPLPWSEAA